MHYGYELSWSKDANASLAAGHPSGLLTDSPEYVVHPPLQWMIAAGMAILVIIIPLVGVFLLR